MMSTPEEFKAFMLWAIRGVDFRRLQAELARSRQEVMEASWWGTKVEQREIGIALGYQAE